MSPKLLALIATLRQLFLFDRADLDFGLYRIMNARRAEVDAFLKQRLPEIARGHLGAVKQNEIDALEDRVREARQSAENYGVADPDNAPPVLAARRALAQASDLSAVEDQVYSLLVTFFSRYYDEGDFITRRRYSGPGRERYMIPYDGEEVKLVWANMDQYYIKSDECLRDYRFRLPPLPEGEPAPAPEADTRPIVFFKLVEADVTKDNVKSANGERRFALAVSDDNPITVSEDGQLLTIPFAHTELPKGTKQAALLDDAERTLLQNTEAELFATEDAQLLAAVPAAFADLLQKAIPNKADPKKTRTLLRFHLDQYTARNTYDYFIHKDLGGFFTRELDYFLKSEVLEIEDLIGQPPEIVERHLRKVQAVRTIAQSVIIFLANLENFQKKLWLKKKFVVETNWCITLDRVPESLFPEIAANDPQLQEWVKLGFIEEKQIPKLKTWLAKCATDGKDHDQKQAPKDLFGKADSKFIPPPSAFSLYMVLDTAFFSDTFKQKLLASIDDIDAQTDGLLIHSENFQALNLLQERYREQVGCAYIDPPYNTGGDGFFYKDAYRHSSWLSMIVERLGVAYGMFHQKGVLYSSIDWNERSSLERMLNNIFGVDNRVEEIIWVQNTTKNQSPTYSTNHEYVEVYVKNIEAAKKDFRMFREAKPGCAEIIELMQTLNPSFPSIGKIETALRSLYKKHRKLVKEEGDDDVDTWKGIYNYNRAEYRDSSGRFVSEEDAVKRKALIWVWREVDSSMPQVKEDSQKPEFRDPNDPTFRFYTPLHPITGNPCPYPKRGWSWPFEPHGRQANCFTSLATDHRIVWGKDENKIPQRKSFLLEVETNVAKSVVNDYTDGEKELTLLFGKTRSFSSPKPTTLIARFCQQATAPSDIVLDFFSGSGTTAHAVMNLNREDDGKRKYILVEMGEHFDTVLKPRIQKVVVSKDWNDGKPTDPASGVSHCFKYLRLESYEDTLNNLLLHRNEAQQQALDLSSSLKNEYLLGYFLDTETADSPSLLNVLQFADPWNYCLKVAEKAVGESRPQAVDLVETFNYLIGLKVERMSEPLSFVTDATPAHDADGRLIVKRLRKAERGQAGSWTFQTVEGTTLAGEKTIVVWRTLSDNPETDSAVLEAYLQTTAINIRESLCDVLYVNGDHTQDNLTTAVSAPEGGLPPARAFKVRLIEPEFRKRMFSEG